MGEFFWRIRVSKFFRVEIHDVQAHIVLYFAFAQIVQMGTPLPILFEVVSHTLGVGRSVR
jgi:hypothetical protein